MQYEIEVGGRTRPVTVARTGDGFAVTLDGRTWQVDAARIDGHTLSLIVDKVWRKHYDVAVVPASEAAGTGNLTVHVGATPVHAAIDGRRRARRREDGSGAAAGPQRVVAPMPGKVVRVLVKSGEVVRARQPLVVVEAMKMENELRAGRSGTVADIQAREGASVDAGALLIVIQ